MSKTLRVRTRTGWTTKPAPDIDENRLTAEEIDDNFLALEDADHDAATTSGNGISITGQEISLDFGTGATQVAAGDHDHSGTYEPADAAIQAHITSAHAPSNAVSLEAVKADTDVADALSKKHAHANQVSLDKVGESGGNPTWNGGAWPGGGGGGAAPAGGLSAWHSPFLVAGAGSRRHLTIREQTVVGIILAGGVETEAWAADTEFDAEALLDTGSTFGAGQDYYLYLVDDAGTKGLKVTLNATFPDGYTAETSRKIGGFHTLCVAVGTISGHPLSGYLAGDILPASVWCLNHRPACATEGMVYSAGVNKWVDIYLASIHAGELASRNGAAHVTGGTTERFHWYKFSQWLGRIGKRMLNQHEFVAASLGSNQGTNITGSANPTNTGGYVDTGGRRMISNIGCESCCGVLWQWGDGDGGGQSSATWVNAFDANDAGVAGQHYLAPNRPLFGGRWNSGASCGSRGAFWNDGPLHLHSHYGVRGCAEPLARGV